MFVGERNASSSFQTPSGGIQTTVCPPVAAGSGLSCGGGSQGVDIPYVRFPPGSVRCGGASPSVIRFAASKFLTGLHPTPRDAGKPASVMHRLKLLPGYE